MAITFDQFYNAISEQESNGNYNAVGAPVHMSGEVHRAYGKYQIMDFNVGPWSKEILGREVSLQEFRNNPSIQERIAKGKLGQYYKKYGPEGAASVWYSGSPNWKGKTRPQGGAPSIQGYVQQVMAKAAKYPATGGKPPAGSTTTSKAPARGRGPKPAAPAAPEVKEFAGHEAAEYGFADSFLTANPEISKLVDNAVKDGWTTNRFQAEMRDTTWWKTHSQRERDALTKQFGDPKTADAEMQAAIVKIRQMANQLGIIESPAINVKYRQWAWKQVGLGWSEGQLRNEIGRHVTFGASGLEGHGEAGMVVDKLQEYAHNMGVTMSTDWYQKHARYIVQGIATLQDHQATIREQSKAMYPQWAKQFDAGKTAMDMAAPYIQSMGNILELPQGSITLFDPTMKNAMQYKDPKTGIGGIKPIWQFENELRSDPRWTKTKNAQDSMMGIAHKVLGDFGLYT